jgi:hypothetical protein
MKNSPPSSPSSFSSPSSPSSSSSPLTENSPKKTEKKKTKKTPLHKKAKTLKRMEQTDYDHKLKIIINGLENKKDKTSALNIYLELLNILFANHGIRKKKITGKKVEDFFNKHNMLTVESKVNFFDNFIRTIFGPQYQHYDSLIIALSKQSPQTIMTLLFHPQTIGYLKTCLSMLTDTSLSILIRNLPTTTTGFKNFLIYLEINTVNVFKWLYSHIHTIGHSYTPPQIISHLYKPPDLEEKEKLLKEPKNFTLEYHCAIFNREYNDESITIFNQTEWKPLNGEVLNLMTGKYEYYNSPPRVENFASYIKDNFFQPQKVSSQTYQKNNELLNPSTSDSKVDDLALNPENYQNCNSFISSTPPNSSFFSQSHPGSPKNDKLFSPFTSDSKVDDLALNPISAQNCNAFIPSTPPSPSFISQPRPGSPKNNELFSPFTSDSKVDDLALNPTSAQNCNAFIPSTPPSPSFISQSRPGSPKNNELLNPFALDSTTEDLLFNLINGI